VLLFHSVVSSVVKQLLVGSGSFYCWWPLFGVVLDPTTTCSTCTVVVYCIGVQIVDQAGAVGLLATTVLVGRWDFETTSSIRVPSG